MAARGNGAGREKLEEGVEERKVQRLGTSSLIVTLPKKWAVQLGIKPGDRVRLRLAGRRIEIIPAASGGEEGRRVVLSLGGEIPPGLAHVIVSCLYVLGADEAVIELDVRPGDMEDIIFSIKRAAQDLIGMDVIEEPGRVTLRVFIDMARLTPDAVARNYLNEVYRLIDLLGNMLSGGDSQSYSRNLEVLKRDLVRYQHLLLRTGRYYVDLANFTCFLSVATYLATTLDILYNLADITAKMEGDSPAADAATRLLSELKWLYSRALQLVFKPSPSEAALARERVVRLSDSIRAALARARGVREGILMASLLSIIRILKIYFNVITCMYVNERLEGLA